MNNKAEQFLNELQGKIKRVAEIIEFNLYVVYTKDIRAGFINKQIGGIYRPVSVNSSISGFYYFIYKDNKIASGSLDSTAWSNFEEFMVAAKLASFEDPNPMPIASSKNISLPKLCDSSIKDIVLNNPEKLLDVIKDSVDLSYENNPDVIENSASYRYSQKAILTSKGLNLSSEGTIQALNFYFDSKISVNRFSRKIFALNELKDEIDLSTRYVKNLKEKPLKISSGKYPILLIPDYSSSFLDHFVLNNINGYSVEGGLSRFSKEDFLQKKLVFPPHLTITVDQTKDMQNESFSFTREGILPQQFNVIENGQLVSPVCDSKTAKNMGFTATDLSSFEDTKVKTYTSYQDFIKANSKFIVIFVCLGIHTQNSVLGEYSIPCPQSLFFEDGEVKGPVNCVINGNAFEKLSSDNLEFIKHDLYKDKFLSFVSNVTIIS